MTSAKMDRIAKTWHLLPVLTALLVAGCEKPAPVVPPTDTVVEEEVPNPLPDTGWECAEDEMVNGHNAHHEYGLFFDTDSTGRYLRGYEWEGMTQWFETIDDITYTYYPSGHSIITVMKDGTGSWHYTYHPDEQTITSGGHVYHRVY